MRRRTSWTARTGRSAVPLAAASSSDVAMATAHRPSSASTTGRPPSRTTAEERVELRGERLGGRDRQLGDLALERRGVAADQPRVRRVGRPRERQALGQVVELEHALLADDDELAALGRRQPVDVEHARSRRTGSGAARTAGPRGRRGSAGRSRRRRATAARRRSTTGCRRRGSRGRRSRRRRGSGPGTGRRGARRSRRRVDSQPAASSRPSSRTAGLNRSTWPTWTGTPRSRAAATIRIPSSTVAASGFSTRTGDAALDRGEGERHVGRGRRRDRRARRAPPRAIIASGSANPWAPALRPSRGERVGDRIGDGREADVGAAGEDPQVVAAHRPEAREADAAAADRRPGARLPVIGRRHRLGAAPAASAPPRWPRGAGPALGTRR